MDDKSGLIKTLRGYEKVELYPGESRLVEVDLPRERFESWDDESNTMRVIPGRYEVMVGNSSADKNMKTIIVKIKP